MRKSRILKLIKKEGILVLSVVYDALSAKIAERARFPAILTGATVPPPSGCKPDLYREVIDRKIQSVKN